MAIRTRRAVASTAALLTIGASSLAVASPPIDVGTSGEVPTVPTSIVGSGDAEPGDRPATDSNDVEPLDVDLVDKEVEVPPVVHCIWVVADMIVDDGVQRVDGGRADDMPDTPSPTPCSSDPASGASVLVDSPGPVVHVRPWSGDEPDARTIEIWVVASHAAGPQAITSLSLSASSDAVTLDPGALSPAGDAADEADEALAAGQASGQIAGLPADDIAGMIDDGWAVAQRAVARLSHLDGCGIVTLEVDAAADGAARTASVSFDVPCYHHLVADYETVDWGVLVRGAENIVAGDLDPTTRDRPTVRNLGNAPLGLVAAFEPLCPVGSTLGCIGSFGIEVGGPDTAFVRVPPQESGTTLEPGITVCPGDVVSLDLVVETPDRAGGGDYAGSMSVVGVPADSECLLGDGSPPTTDTAGPTSTDFATTEPPTSTERPTPTSSPETTDRPTPTSSPGTTDRPTPTSSPGTTHAPPRSDLPVPSSTSAPEP